MIGIEISDQKEVIKEAWFKHNDNDRNVCQEFMRAPFAVKSKNMEEK